MSGRFFTRDVTIHSPLAPDALTQLLRSNTDPYPHIAPWVPRAGKPLLGSVISNAVSVRLRARYFGKNGLGAVFTGHVEPESGGSMLRGMVGADPTLQSLLWIALVMGLCVVAVMTVLAFLPGVGSGVVGIAAAIGAMLGWIFIWTVLSLLHWPQRQRMVDTLRQMVDGTDWGAFSRGRDG